MGIFDKPAPAPVDRGPRGKEAERILIAELLDAFRHQANSTTEFMERFGGQIVNNVLEVFTGQFDGSGQITRTYKVAAGSIEVNYLAVAANVLTVSAATGGGSAPVGTGTYKVGGGTCRTVSLASHSFTLYGNAGDTVSFQVFTAGVRPVTA